MYQFHPQHDFVKSIIKETVLGEPILFQANFGFPPMNENNFRYNANWRSFIRRWRVHFTAREKFLTKAS